MSFLLDPGLLVASGIAIERIVPDEGRDAAEVATIATFMGISAALYANAPGLGLFWKPFRAKGGRDFMLNSGVFHVRSDPTGWQTHLVAAGIFATYPLWLKAGRRMGARGRGPSHEAVPDAAIATATATTTTTTTDGDGA